MKKNIRAGVFAFSLFCASLSSICNSYANSNEIFYFEQRGSDIQLFDLSTSKIYTFSSSNIPEEVYDFKKIQLTIPENYQGDLYWIQQCHSLEILKIYDFSNRISLNFLHSLPTLKEFTIYEKERNSELRFEDLISCKDLQYLEINSPNTFDVSLLGSFSHLKDLFLLNGNYQNLDFLKQYTSLDSLRIGVNNSLPPSFLESLTHLKKLKLYLEDPYPIDYTKLSFLEELSFGNSLPYTIAIYFQISDYDFLTDHGVKVISDKKGVIEKVLEIDLKLEDMVSQLGVNSTSYDIDKLDAVYLSVLNHLSYDPKILKLAEAHQDYYYYTPRFYKEGLLYGVFENDHAICGNYAALFSSLSHRVGLKSYYLSNPYHAWNLVCVNGNYYYADATMVESSNSNPEQSIRNKNRNLRGYLEDPNTTHDIFHEANRIPFVYDSESFSLKRNL